MGNQLVPLTILLYTRCHTNRGHYNRVQLYMYYELPPYKLSHVELLQFIMASKPQAICSSDHQEIPCILWNLNVHYHVHKNLPHVLIPSQMNHINCLPSYEGHLESKERFAIQRYLLIIGKKKNIQVL